MTIQEYGHSVLKTCRAIEEDKGADKALVLMIDSIHPYNKFSLSNTDRNKDGLVLLLKVGHFLRCIGFV